MKVLIALLISFGGAVVTYACEAASASSEPSREAVHAAFEACATENNLTRPEPGQRPSDADRATMESCLKSKGINHRTHPPRHERPQQNNPQEAE